MIIIIIVWWTWLGCAEICFYTQTSQNIIPPLISHQNSGSIVIERCISQVNSVCDDLQSSCVKLLKCSFLALDNGVWSMWNYFKSLSKNYR